jgi:hypothetical protein
VDHDYDTVFVWLNPEVYVGFIGNIINFGGLAYDPRDPLGGMDVVQLTIGQLKGTQSISDAKEVTRIARGWDTYLGGLSPADFLEIAKADPFFVNPNFNPNTDTSHRFELPMSGTPATPVKLIIDYAPAPSGGQPIPETYSSIYSTSSQTAYTVSDTHTVTWSGDQSAGASYFISLSLKMSDSSSYTSSNKTSQTISNGKTQSASFTIVPPASTDNYQGLTAIQVWKDNVYGTFMFFPAY